MSTQALLLLCLVVLLKAFWGASSPAPDGKRFNKIFFSILHIFLFKPYNKSNANGDSLPSIYVQEHSFNLSLLLSIFSINFVGEHIYHRFLTTAPFSCDISLIFHSRK